MQHGVNAELLSRLQMRRQPFTHRRIDQMLRGKHLHVHLLAHLDRVASIHKDGSLAGQNRCNTGRPGKSRQPLQAAVMWRHVFALMGIRARDQKAVEAEAGKFGPEKRCMRRSAGGITEIFEGLEHERHGNLTVAADQDG